MGLYNLREGCTGQEVVEGGSEKGVSARRPGDGWGSVRRGEARRAIPFLPALGNSIPRVWYMAVDVGFLLAAWKMTGPDHIHIHTHTHARTQKHTHTHTVKTHSQSDNCVRKCSNDTPRCTHKLTEIYNCMCTHIHILREGKRNWIITLPKPQSRGWPLYKYVCVCVNISCISAVSAIGTLVVCLCCCAQVCVGMCVWVGV